LQDIDNIKETIISDEEFDLLDALDDAQKTEELNRLYNASVRDRQIYLEHIQRKNKEYRYNLLSTQDAELRAMIHEKCERSVLYYVNTILRTYNPRLQNANLPFITYPFQDRFILDVVDSIET